MPYEIRHKHFTEGPFYKIADLALHAQNSTSESIFVKTDKSGDVVVEYKRDHLDAIRTDNKAKFEATHERRFYHVGATNLSRPVEYWVKK